MRVYVYDARAMQIFARETSIVECVDALKMLNSFRLCGSYSNRRRHLDWNIGILFRDILLVTSSNISFHVIYLKRNATSVGWDVNFAFFTGLIGAATKFSYPLTFRSLLSFMHRIRISNDCSFSDISFLIFLCISLVEYCWYDFLSARKQESLPNISLEHNKRYVRDERCAAGSCRAKWLGFPRLQDVWRPRISTNRSTSYQGKRRADNGLRESVGDDAAASGTAGREKGILTPSIRRYYLR